MNTFPLAKKQLLGSSTTQGSGAIRSETESGIAKTRRRFSAVTSSLSTSLDLTGSELATLQAFYRDDLADGVLPFEWEDLATDDTVVMRFTSPPAASLITGHSNPDQRTYRVALALEILP